MRIAVVGVGLIGGSIALAARQRLGATVVGFDRDPQALHDALSRGLLDEAADDLGRAVREAEVAFVAVPVGDLAEAVPAVLARSDEDCVVSDVGSTKRAIVSAVRDRRFVGGHPLAGAETSGAAHARADLFDGATWYLTPVATTSGLLYERLHHLLRGLGARPTAIEPETHDAILAAVSHLPHVLANTLVTQASRALAVGGERLPATGPSFRDATRVAGASSAIWTDIYTSNADALIEQIEGTVDQLEQMREALRRGDRSWITSWNERAASERARLIEDQLGSSTLLEIRASVPNRPGVVAQLALELGRAGINIIDLAVHPAPDMTEGVIALWLSGEREAQRAVELVRGLGYPAAPA
jgi:prephenate dehydrogenase